MSYVLRATPDDPVGFRVEHASGDSVEEANRFLRSLWARALSPLTIRTYGYGLVVLYRWMQATGRDLATLTGVHLVEWILSLRERGASSHTINHRLHTCYQLYRFTFDREMPAPPSGLITPTRHPSHIFDHRLGVLTLRRRQGTKTLRAKPMDRLIEPLSAAQINAFLTTTTRYRDLAIVLLMLLCGLRSREVLHLRLGDLDLAGSQIRVLGKGNKERALPVPAPLATALRKFLYLERPPESASDRVFVILRGRGRGKPMTVAGLRSLFRSRRRLRQTLRMANPHRFRHTFGADMARSGVRLPVLQQMMGHASGLTTLRYIRLSIEDIAEEYHRAMDRIGKRYVAGLES